MGARRSLPHSGEDPFLAEAPRLPSEASEKTIVWSQGRAQSRPTGHKGPSFSGHWPLSPRPPGPGPHPSWHAKGLLLALFCFLFFLLLKEKRWEAPWATLTPPPLAVVSPAERRAPVPAKGPVPHTF